METLIIVALVICAAPVAYALITTGLIAVIWYLDLEPGNAPPPDPDNIPTLTDIAP